MGASFIASVPETKVSEWREERTISSLMVPSLAGIASVRSRAPGIGSADPETPPPLVGPEDEASMCSVMSA